MAIEVFKKKIDGMICPQCEDEIYKAVIHKKGVCTANVSYRKSEIELTFENEILSPEEIENLLKEIGYPVGNGGTSLKTDLTALLAVLVLCFAVPALSSLIPVPSMEVNASVLMIFLVGVLSGAHCIAMCGGIMLTQSNRLSYNGGRVLSYMIAGAVFGAIGEALSFDTQTKSMIYTMCGLLVVVIGLRMWGVPILRKLTPELKGRCILKGSSFGIGILNGFMPCAILSTMWLNAAASGSWIKGTITMLSFGLGTCVLMLILAYFGKILPQQKKKYMIKANTILIVSLGILQIVKGLQLVL